MTNLAQATERLRAAATRMSGAAKARAEKGDESDLPQRMNFDAAWCWKAVGDVEVELARRAQIPESPRRKIDRVASEADLKSIPLQPGETAAREAFKAVVDAAGDSPVVEEARVELIEMLAARDETGPAIDQLKEALGKGPNPDLAERLRLRLATLYLAGGDAKSAAAVIDPTLAADRNAYTAYAKAVAAEAAYQQKDWPAVVRHAAYFVDSPKNFGRMVGLADHAMLRMADAQLQLGQAKEARATIDAWFGRFLSSPLVAEARAVAVRAGEQGGAAGTTDVKTPAAPRVVPAAGRLPVSPAVGVTLRIPSLLNNPRRTATSAAMLPAGPVEFPAVNNPQGSPALAPLPPVARAIPVEIAPPAAPLGIDQAPYLASPAAPDERETAVAK
jgi:tetratricopeptide (TPR) repeat protein